MQVKNPQDFATGLLFLALGAATLYIGADYAMGSLQRPGSGVLPRILAWALIAVGTLLSAKSIAVAGPGLGNWAWRPLLLVPLATIAFALLVDRAGLVAAMVASMVLTAAGSNETRWREFAIFAVIMLVIGVGVFIKLLGMPITIWPSLPGLVR
ncbi:MAG: tripartite tricarboxylate transporter TctB family protein [Hyphomicrobiaceae bacterium]